MFNPWRRRPIDLKRAGLGGVLGGRARSPCGELRDPFNRKCVISAETHLSHQIYKAMQITLQGKAKMELQFLLLNRAVPSSASSSPRRHHHHPSSVLSRQSSRLSFTFGPFSDGSECSRCYILEQSMDVLEKVLTQ